MAGVRRVRADSLDTMDPARVCAALAPLIAEERRARLDSMLAARLSGLTVTLENLHDPHNGAAALRSCEAAGLDCLHVVEGTERFQFSSKVTQGCERWIEIVRHRSTTDAVAHLRASGYRLAAALPDAERTLDEVDAGGAPLALWFGNEHEGLSRAAREAADIAFRLPMAGMTRSLNLSVAVALAVFRAAALRRAALGHSGDLDEAAQLRRRARFYFDDVRGAAAVLRRAGLLR